MIRLVAAFAIVALTALPVAADDSAKPTPYTSAKYGFTATFPWQVKETSKDDGLTLLAGNSDDTIAYMFSVIHVEDVVLKSKTSDQILEAAVAGAAENAKGKLLKKTDIKISGYPGKAFDINSDKFLAQCRIYIVGNQMYLPMVISQPGKPLPMSADDFHASFKLIKGSGKKSR